MKTATTTIGTFEAKNRFSELIEKVGRGAEITITRHDKPVARLVPPTAAEAESRRQAVRELRHMRMRYRLEGLSGKELIAAGRR